MRRIKTLPWAEIIVTLVALAAGAGVYLYAHRGEDELEESKRRGAAVVQALGAYHDEHHSYPATLEQLVPQYAPGVEPPVWGLKRWRYRTYTATPAAREGAATHDSLYFQLSVAASESGYPVLFYDPTTRRWVLNN